MKKALIDQIVKSFKKDIAKHPTISVQDVMDVTLESYKKFRRIHLRPFIEEHSALPFDENELLTDIYKAIKAAFGQFNPSRGSSITSYIAQKVFNYLRHRWRDELNTAKRNGWYLLNDLSDIELKVKWRKFLKNGEFEDPDDVQLVLDDLTESDKREIDEAISKHVKETLSKDISRSSVTTFPYDRIELLDLISTLQSFLRATRRTDLENVLRLLLSGQSERQIAVTIGKDKKQVSRWIRKIEEIGKGLVEDETSNYPTEDEIKKMYEEFQIKEIR